MTTTKPLPKAFLARLRDMLSPTDYETTLAGFSSERVCSFRVNTFKSTSEEVESVLVKHNIPFTRVPFIPLAYTIAKKDEFALKGSDIFYGGKIYMQWLASQIPALLLDLQPGARVFDVTAAPGSKTTQIAALMDNTGSIVACEKHQIRYDKLVHNIALQWATNIETLKMDALDFCSGKKPPVSPLSGGQANTPLTRGEERSDGGFDAILLDAPCSAEGRIRADDERTFGFWSRDNTLRNAGIQKELLEATVPLLKSGGTLVYSTCTLAPEENEEVINALLEKFSDLRLEPISLDFEYARPGLTKFRDTIYREDLKNTLRIIPSPFAEGFFVAKLRKA